MTFRAVTSGSALVTLEACVVGVCDVLHAGRVQAGLSLTTRQTSSEHKYLPLPEPFFL